MGERDALRTELWRLADRLRGTIDGTPLGTAKVAIIEGLAPTWREQAAVAQELRIAEAADPAVVADFLLAYTDGAPPVRALDPWAGFGISLAALDEAGRLGPSLAIEINPDVYDVIRVSRSTANIDWRLGDAATVLDGPVGPFDLVVGSPPINLPRVEAKVGPYQRPIRLSQTYVMVSQAATLMATGGSMALVVPESMFWGPDARVIEVLAECGVYPSAALALPRRGFGVSVPLTLAVFGRERRERLFVAELSGTSDVRAVVANLRAWRPGRLASLGRLVELATFRGWRAIELEEEVVRLSRASGLRAVPLRDVCAEVRTPRRGTAEPFEALPNAVYLPSIGTSPAVTAVADMKVRPQNYLQLALDGSAVDAEYLASFLNSPLGRSVRELMVSGGTIPHVTKDGALSASVYLPPQREQQGQAVAVDRTLRELQQSVEALRRRLWEAPTRARQVQADLGRLVEGDGIERWRETLPFPLASILWRVEAEEDAQARCRYLVHFFEALVILLVDLHLSALRQDADVLSEARRSSVDHVQYGRASVGIWADLLSRLAKRTRTVAGADPSLGRELFRVADIERVERVSAVALTSVLKDEAANYRNRWIGHGAPVREDEWARRTGIALAALDRVRAVIGDAFAGWELVRAGRGGNRAGVVTLSVERLTGSQRAFRRARVQLREWPEEGGLYMHEDGAESALPMSPLVALKRGPAAEDACYFFDRLEGDHVWWVSYHFEGEPEVDDEDSAVRDLILELNGLG